MKQRLIASFLVIGLAFVGFSYLDKSSSNCVNVYIDYGLLDNSTKIQQCVEVSTKTNALEILKTPVS